MSDTKIEVPGKIRRLRLTSLSSADYNPRTISPEAMNGLRDSLSRFGMLEMPVVNRIDGELRIVSGHQRVRAMMAEGIQDADCLVVQLDGLEERIANLTMNNPAIRGSFDVQKLAAQIPDLSASLPKPGFARFDALLEDIRRRADRMTAESGATATDAVVKKPAKPKSRVGRIYQLGKHRVFCGDFATGLPKLLGKRRAQLCVTDPPYNVDYESAAGDSIENDAMSAEDWGEFVGTIAKAILKHTAGPSFVCMSSKEVPSLARAWEQAGGSVARWLFWVKDRFTLGRGDYHHQHEPIMLGTRTGDALNVKPGHSNVLEFPKPSANPLHPTQKPIELIRALIDSASDGGDLVIDPFAGSGTTLVVAEELGRKCYACELDPRFVDSIRQRWAEQVHGAGCEWPALTAAVP